MIRIISDKKELKKFFEFFEVYAYKYYTLTICEYREEEGEDTYLCDWFGFSDSEECMHKLKGFLPFEVVETCSEYINEKQSNFYIWGASFRICLEMYANIDDYVYNLFAPQFVYFGLCQEGESVGIYKLRDYVGELVNSNIVKIRCGRKPMSVELVGEFENCLDWSISCDNFYNVIQEAKEELLECVAVEFSDFNLFWNVVELIESNRAGEIEKIEKYLNPSDDFIIEILKNVILKIS